MAHQLMQLTKQMPDVKSRLGDRSQKTTTTKQINEQNKTETTESAYNGGEKPPLSSGE